MKPETKELVQKAMGYLSMVGFISIMVFTFDGCYKGFSQGVKEGWYDREYPDVTTLYDRVEGNIPLSIIYLVLLFFGMRYLHLHFKKHGLAVDKSVGTIAILAILIVAIVNILGY